MAPPGGLKVGPRHATWPTGRDDTDARRRRTLGAMNRPLRPSATDDGPVYLSERWLIVDRFRGVVRGSVTKGRFPLIPGM